MKTIREDIAGKSFKRIYLLFGEEEYLVNHYRDAIVNACVDGSGDGMNYNRFSGELRDIREVTEIILTLPFFSDRRVVVLEDSGLFGADTPFTDIIAEIPDTTVVVMVDHKPDKRTRLFKEIKKYGHICEFTHPSPEETAVFMAGRLAKAGKKITEKVCERFVRDIGCDLYMVVSETDKLIAYTGERDVVTDSDIDAVCSVRVENRIFEIVEAVLTGRRQDALSIWYGLIALRESPMGLLRFMTRQFMRLGAIKELSDAGKGDSEIAGVLHMADWLARKNRQLVRKKDQAFFNESVRLCTAAEEQFKSGDLDDETAVEILLANLCTL